MFSKNERTISILIVSDYIHGFMGGCVDSKVSSPTFCLSKITAEAPFKLDIFQYKKYEIENISIEELLSFLRNNIVSNCDTGLHKKTKMYYEG